MDIDTWHRLIETKKAVRFKMPDHEYIIYKGVKIVYKDNSIQLFDTSTDFYTEIEYDGEKLVDIIGRFKKNQYIREADAVERHIRYEINNKRNHRKLSRLKTRRVNLMHKLYRIITELFELNGTHNRNPEG
jgi:hypothetical protein